MAIFCALNSPMLFAQVQLLNETVEVSEQGGRLVPVIKVDVVEPQSKRQEPRSMESDRTPSKLAVANKISGMKKPEKIIEHTHFIYPDESYFDAINRWLHREGYKAIAWDLDDTANEQLGAKPAGVISFAGGIAGVMDQLSRQLGVPFYFSVEQKDNLAAIHQWHGREVQVTYVTGNSLRDAVASLVHAYGWNWGESDSMAGASWQARNNYSYDAFPIVTPKSDMARALKVMLQGYPVKAKLLYSNHKVFITEE
ncbi:hypothetical protein AYI81_20420 [Shewanella algae]|nr:hypothetical protein AYI80_19450 [Shewanella algae]TXS83018.1 hypothetical protein AYI81_20420 [Shewanella algae]